jgi:hypothetical protein
MTLREEVVGMLQNGPRIEENLEIDIKSNITNLRLAVGELQNIAVRPAEEIDRLDADT